MRYLLLLLPAILLFSCEKEEDFVIPTNRQLLQNRTYEKTLIVEGHDYDGLIIRDCDFEGIEGDGLIIRDADNVIVKGCTFNGISANGILLSPTGSSNAVEIRECVFSNIDAHGIHVNAAHSRVQIHTNRFENVGLDPSSTLVAAPHHGIFVQGPAFSITENVLLGVTNENANNITVESYGTVARNTVVNASKYGISYVGNQQANSDGLLVQNNIIYDNLERGINLAAGTSNSPISSATIRFNTIVALPEKAPIGIGPDLDPVNIRVAGNLTVRPDGNQAHVLASSPYSSEFNYEASEDPGFIDYAGRDLHLTDSTDARGFATPVSDFPNQDFDKQTRSGDELEPGADEL